MIKSPEILAVIGNGLIKAAIRQLSTLYVGDAMHFADTLSKCLNGEWHPDYLLVESSVIPLPHAYSLEKIKSKNPGLSILLIETVKLEDEALPFITNVINSCDSEGLVLKKIKAFLSDAENAGEKPTISLNLSQREQEIVKWVALGKTNKEISDALFISPHTVVTHRKNITAKLGIKTIAGLTVYAILNNLISTDKIP